MNQLLTLELPLWVPLLAGLGLTITLYLHGLAEGRRQVRRNIAQEYRRHRAQSLLLRL